MALKTKSLALGVCPFLPVEKGAGISQKRISLPHSLSATCTDRFILDVLIQTVQCWNLACTCPFDSIFICLFAYYCGAENHRPLHKVGKWSATEPHSSLISSLNPLLVIHSAQLDVRAVCIVLMLGCLGNSNENSAHGLTTEVFF